MLIIIQLKKKKEIIKLKLKKKKECGLWNNPRPRKESSVLALYINSIQMVLGRLITTSNHVP